MGHRRKADRCEGGMRWRSRIVALYEESLAIRRELRDRLGMASVLGNLRNVAYERGDFIAARALSQEALAILRELGDRGRIADALNNLGNVAYDQGDLSSARALNEESLAIRACSHYRSPSTMSAKLMKATNMTSSFSNREKMRRKPLRRRNSRSISLRRLYMARLYSHAVIRPCLGGTTGTKPRSSASCRVSSPSYARSISRYIGQGVLPSLRSSLRPSGASWAWPGDKANVMAVRASAATI